MEESVSPVSVSHRCPICVLPSAQGLYAAVAQATVRSPRLVSQTCYVLTVLPWHFLQQAPYPVKNLEPGELVIAPKVKALLGTVKVYTGPGKRVQHDRLLIEVRSVTELGNPTQLSI